MRQSVDRGRERDAEHDEEDVGHGQVEDQQVRRVPHLLVERHHEDDEQVTEESHDDDDGEEDGDDDAHDQLEAGVLGLLRRGHLHLLPRRDLGRVEDAHLDYLLSRDFV